MTKPKTTHVFRVEDKKGDGPYQRGAAARWTDNDVYSTDKHPVPSQDGLPSLWDMKHYFCGFASMEQLQEWFCPEDRKKLDVAKYQCSVYDVPIKHMKKGGKQVIFDKSKATLLETRSL